MGKGKYSTNYNECFEENKMSLFFQFYSYCEGENKHMLQYSYDCKIDSSYLNNSVTHDI